MRDDTHGRWSILASAAMVVFGCGQDRILPDEGPATITSGVVMVHDTAEPLVAEATGEARFDTANPRGCAAGFTTITDAKGIATHLGAMSLRSEHCVTPTGDLSGSLVLTAADGDEVHATYTGSSTAPGVIGEPIHVSAAMVIAGGTGRFANAIGSAEVSATVTFEGFGDPSWPIRWRCQGSIRF